MKVREAVAALGGPIKVAAAMGLGFRAVSMWSHRDRVPTAHLAAFWSMCADAGVAWTPPGGEGRVPVLRRAA